MKLALLFVLAFITSLSMAKPSWACEVALALTVDVSGSVNKQEYALQMNGLAGALRDPTVADALVSKQATLMLIQWTGASRQVVSIPWRQIATLSDVEELANQVEKSPREWRNFSTAIGDALTFTAAQFKFVPECKRKVIDVSGDGYSNEGSSPLAVRMKLQQQDFTINGLAIEGSADGLTRYYRDNVIAGNGAFVMTANTFEEYPKRIKQKLFREVTNQLAALEMLDKRF